MEVRRHKVSKRDVTVWASQSNLKLNTMAKTNVMSTPKCSNFKSNICSKTAECLQMLDFKPILLIWLQGCRKLLLRDTERCVCMILQDEASTRWRRVSDEGLSVASPYTWRALHSSPYISPHITHMNVRLLQLTPSNPNSTSRFSLRPLCRFQWCFQLFSRFTSNLFVSLQIIKHSVHTDVFNQLWLCFLN